MGKALSEYLELERQLLEWRQAHPEDTPEEDEMLDNMDAVWWQLSDEEVRWINSRHSSAQSSMVTMTSDLQEIFRLNEPELVLESFSEDSGAVFRLLDCDGYRLGRLTCQDVCALCVTTRWESFSSVILLSSSDLDSRFSWLSSSIPEGFQLVAFQVSGDAADDSALPLIQGERLGYIICRSVSFVAESDRGR